VSLADLSVRRPIGVSVVVVGTALFGVLALGYLPVDLMPEIEAPVISLITRYPGANAEDVEEKVTELLEKSLGDIPDLEEINSISKDSLSIVGLEFAYGTNLDEAANRIRDNVEFVKNAFPADAEDPLLFHFSTTQFPVLMLCVATSGGDEFANRQVIEDRILEPLRRVPGVGGVHVWNAPERQIHVEVDAGRLAAYGLTLQHVGQVLAAEGVTMPAGNLDVGRTQFAVRLPADYATLDDVRAIILGRGAGGGIVRVDDVATVREGLEELDEVAEVDGEPTMWVGVVKRSGGNTVEVAERVKTVLEGIRADLPPTMRVLELADASRFILRTLDNLRASALLGAVLVIAVVWGFLRNWRASAVIALAIPSSTLVTFLLLYLCGFTLNTMSLLAVAIAMGMVVDNAIVVLENVSRHREQAGAAAAAAAGANEVAAAIGASTITSVIIFAPLIFVTGLVGVLFGQLAFVLTVTLLASLAVALTLIPAYGAHFLRAADAATAGFDERAAASGWFARLVGGYRRMLETALRHRIATVVSSVIVAAATVAMVTRLGFDFIPRQDAGEIHFRAEMPAGTRVEETVRVGRRLAAIARQQPEVEMVSYKAGVARVAWASALGGREGSNIVGGQIKLAPFGERRRRDWEVADALRAEFARQPEIVSFGLDTGDMFSRVVGGLGRPLTIEIFGDHYADMVRAAERVRALVAGTPGTQDVALTLFEPRPELRVVLDRERASRLGVTASGAAAALRASLYGTAVTQFRPRGDDIDLVVRLAEPGRRTEADIGAIEVPTLHGTPVELREVARLVEDTNLVEIRRKNNQRVVTVGANVRDRALGDVSREVEAGLAAERFPIGVSTQLAGEVSEQRKTFRDLQLLILVGGLLVYLVMAAQYESLIDPFVIMLSVPFCFTGAFLALVLTGTTLSVPAVLGLVMLLGVVVNNAIVLVDYANQLRRAGLGLEQAMLVTGARRLRPILMTTVTTVFGALPLALGRGEGAEFWAPLGRVVVGVLAEPLRDGRWWYSLRGWLRRGRLPVSAPAREPAGVAASGLREAPTWLGPDATDPAELLRAFDRGRANIRELRAVGSSPPRRAADCVAALASVLPPDRANGQDYLLTAVDGGTLRLRATRCPASAVGAECAVLPRLLGALDGLGVASDVSPPIGACPLALGGTCDYTIRLRFDDSADAGDL
jgi:HAE1 family hydrophobic/amphiphilic exporter-1